MKYYGGVDLGGTNTKIGLLDEEGNLIFKTTIKTLSEEGHEKTVERICDVMLHEMEVHEVEHKELISVGVGIPGPAVNKRVIKMFANFPWPKNLDLAAEFEKHLKVPTFIDNDVNVITLGEVWVGAGKGHDNVLGMAIGTGIGGGIVSNGSIISGKVGAAAEVGHIKIVKDGILCGCGQRGCFEAYASATGIIREAESRLKVRKDSSLYEVLKTREIEAKDVFDAAKEGDKMALSIVEDEASYLAYGISMALNILDPEMVIIGGGVALAGDFLFDKVKKLLPLYTLPPILEGLEIKASELGNDAGIYGAAYLAITENKGVKNVN